MTIIGRNSDISSVAHDDEDDRKEEEMLNVCVSESLAIDTLCLGT